MKIAGELIGGGYECVCVPEMMEIVGELEESMDGKVSDSATLLLKRLYGRGKVGEKERLSVTVSGLIREKDKEREDKEAEKKEKEEGLKREQKERTEKEQERKEKEEEKREKEWLRRELDEFRKRSDSDRRRDKRDRNEMKQEIEESKKIQMLPDLLQPSITFIVFFNQCCLFVLNSGNSLT
jgi:Ca2+-dependent lipid-binding protein